MMSEDQKKRSWRGRFVDAIYATHNRSDQISEALAGVLDRLQEDELGLNVGAGATNLHPSVMNLDIVAGPTVDFCAPAERLPFSSDSFSVVVSQETLEHVQDPWLAIREIHRVLRPGGTLYLQLPFVIGFHPGPTDYWRFSRQGIRQLVEEAGFHDIELGMAVGPATGFYRIVVEFTAVVLSVRWSSLYYPAKGAAALLFYPLKFLDKLLMRSAQADRIAGGYYVITRKCR